jgi:MscS family membrane protein
MDFINDLWNRIPPNIQDAILRLVLAALVLALFWAARNALSYLLLTPLRRLVKRTGSDWAEALLEALIIPVRLVILGLGLLIFSLILGADAVTYTFISHVFRTLLIVAVFLTGIRLVGIVAPTSLRLFAATGVKVDERLLPFIRTILKLLLIALAAVIIVQEWGYDVTGLAAALGISGLALSLAAQDTAKNLFGFSTIVGDSPFVVGDFIKTPDVEGTVEHVGIRSTRIRQNDQAYVTIPNATLANSAILNWSRLSKRWINMTLRVTYDAQRAELEMLLENLRAMLKSREKVDADSVLVRFINFGDAGMEILIRCYVVTADWGEFTEEREQINLQILKIVEDLGLHIAFPARPLYVETVPKQPIPGGTGGEENTESKK